MSDISLETRQKSMDDAQQKAMLLQQQEEVRLAKATECFTMLDALYRCAEWKWFHQEVMGRAVREMHDAALDVETKSAAQREQAVQQHAFGVKLMGLLVEQRRFWAGQAGVTNDELSPLGGGVQG